MRYLGLTILLLGAGCLPAVGSHYQFQQLVVQNGRLVVEAQKISQFGGSQVLLLCDVPETGNAIHCNEAATHVVPYRPSTEKTPE
jgi:hypothetical protein